MVGGIILFDLLLVFIIGEVALRIIPIAGIKYNEYRFDPDVGSGLYPHSKVIYRNDQGVHVVREVNRWGFLDKDHEPQKPDGVFRIGFFGDSYTEAEHVELKDTFFRRIESMLTPKRVETLAFGVTGYSMLQAHLLFLKWADFFDIDLAVYVFVENDLGDQLATIDRSWDKPYLVLKDGEMVVDYGFREKHKHKQKFLYRIAKYLTAKSLLMATVSERLKLLKRYGIQMRITEQERKMATKAKDVVNVVATDLPSTWPIALRNEAQKLGRLELLKFREDVARHQKDFAVLYVPRETEYQKPVLQQDSWKLWLETLCRYEGIRFIDPTLMLMRTAAAGQPVYYDHFTPAGHEAFAIAFKNWFVQNYKF